MVQIGDIDGNEISQRNTSPAPHTASSIIFTPIHGRGPSLTRSRPASPVLTAQPGAISLQDLAGSGSGSYDDSGGFRWNPHAMQPGSSQTRSIASSNSLVSSQPPSTTTAASSHAATEAALTPAKNPYGQCEGHASSRGGSANPATASRPASISTVRSRSPAVTGTKSGFMVGGDSSPASTPLLSDTYQNYQFGHTGDESHSSSSFLLPARQSYSAADLHTRRTPAYNCHKRPKWDNPFSPSSISYRTNRFLHDVRLALGIGVRGEWKDPETGKWKIPLHLKAYIPLLIWLAVSIAFGVIIGIWHGPVFAGLDSLSTYLKSQGIFGDFILYLCIFLTTFPPLPLYSTLIILSGYSFGLLEGFIISYTAALSGAIVVYLCSKVWLKDGMEDLLNKSQGLKKVIRAIERRPRLLWLIRLSPYPYNVMNVLLASSSTLTFSCYFWCTALALPKLLIHCSVGTTIRSFAGSAQDRGEAEFTGDHDEELARELSGQRMKATAGAIGLLLCVGVFIYLLIVARRAVDELDGADQLPTDGRARSSSTLEGHLGHQGIPEGRTSMAEYRPLSTGLTHSSTVRPAFDAGEFGSSIAAEFNLERLESPVTARKSFAIDMDGVAQRQTFERQNTTTGIYNAKRVHSTDLPPWHDDEVRSMQWENVGDGGENRELQALLYADKGVSGDGTVIDRLEKVAYDRS